LVDTKLIRELVQLMAENDLTSIELRNGEEQVSLRRRTHEPPVVMTGTVGPPGATPAEPVVNREPVVEPPPAAPDPDAGCVPIVSPMVGTFYATPKPDADPFVQVGSSVTPHSVVCVVEAMKVFNEIKAEMAGTIVRVLVANEAPVEYGQPLFLVRPGR